MNISQRYAPVLAEGTAASRAGHASYLPSWASRGASIVAAIASLLPLRPSATSWSPPARLNADTMLAVIIDACGPPPVPD